MSAPLKLAVFAAALVAIFALGVGIGSLVSSDSDSDSISGSIGEAPELTTVVLTVADHSQRSAH